jgi:hypothetical protein
VKWQKIYSNLGKTTEATVRYFIFLFEDNSAHADRLMIPKQMQQLLYCYTSILNLLIRVVSLVTPLSVQALLNRRPMFDKRVVIKECSRQCTLFAELNLWSTWRAKSIRRPSGSNALMCQDAHALFTQHIKNWVSFLNGTSQLIEN